ncbi:hypothetical protein GXW82_12205 [Streptacidiphilus sp. 4-A2]|nr:hypothetical protein [Streptacidiphilus sp. 4-A2]
MNTPTGSIHIFSAIGHLFRTVAEAHRAQTDAWERILSCPRSTRTGL